MQVDLHLLEMGGPCGASGAVGGEILRGDRQLLRHVLAHRGWRRLEIVGRKPSIPQRTELEGKPQTHMGLAVLVDDPVIGLR